MAAILPLGLLNVANICLFLWTDHPCENVPHRAPSRNPWSLSLAPHCAVYPLLLTSLAWHSGLAQVPETAPSPARRVKVSDDVASSLVLQKARLVYPDAARKAGIQGTVVLKVVTSGTGEVKEVTVVSGDPLLGQAAADAVKQWKYKPYTVDNVPVEMETQVSIKFQFKSAEHAAPPLGSFKDGMYLKELLDILYPLSRDWVRETQVMRKKLSMEPGLPGISVLLAAVHSRLPRSKRIRRLFCLPFRLRRAATTTFKT